MKSLFYLVVTMVVMIACTNEEFDANSEVKKEEVKTKIASLAEKYDVNVDFFEINPSEKTENEMSLEEIEELFRDIKQLREHPVELKMYKDKEENGCMFYSTKEQKPSVPLAKTRSEIYSFNNRILSFLILFFALYFRPCQQTNITIFSIIIREITFIR